MDYANFTCCGGMNKREDLHDGDTEEAKVARWTEPGRSTSEGQCMLDLLEIPGRPERDDLV